jgi:uncharacterized protein (DUF302 family)
MLNNGMCGSAKCGHRIGVFGGGLLVGLLAAGVAVWALMPGMMIDVHESKLPFGETVSAIQEAVARQGWVLSGTRDMQKSLAKHGRPFARRVTLVEICHPDYARRVLTDNREVSTLMPCAIAVYEGDDGKVYVSKMNTGLMGKMFGGTVAEVMGGAVAADEKAMLAGIIR